MPWSPLDLFPDGASFLDGSGERYTLVGINTVYVVDSSGHQIEVPFTDVVKLIEHQPALRAAHRPGQT